MQSPTSARTIAHRQDRKFLFAEAEEEEEEEEEYSERIPEVQTAQAPRRSKSTTDSESPCASGETCAGGRAHIRPPCIPKDIRSIGLGAKCTLTPFQVRLRALCRE